MNIAIITLFTLAFAAFAVVRFHAAIAVMLLLLPSYLLRFSIGPVPSTLLEVMLIVLLVVWIVREGPVAFEYMWQWMMDHRMQTVGMVLFVVGATVGLWVAPDIRAAAGAWKAFYIEPILFFFLLITTIEDSQQLRTVLLGLLGAGAATGVLAVVQGVTGVWVPYDFWENANTYRVTGWYGFPNGVGLFLAPLVPLAVYALYLTRDTRGFWRMERGVALLVLLTAPIAIVLAKSTGAIIGVAAACFFLLVMKQGTRYVTLAVTGLAVLLLLTLPQAAPVRDELLLKDRSGQIRIAMWGEATSFLQAHPVVGAGLAGYQERIVPYHTTVQGEGIEIFHHPHNIFLTLWVNIGLVGLVGFILIIWSSFSPSVTGATMFGTWALQAALIALLIHGLVDSPYIKNDLALLFWCIVACISIHTRLKRSIEVVVS